MGTFHILGEEAYVIEQGNESFGIDCGLGKRPWPDGTNPIIQRAYRQQVYGPRNSLLRQFKLDAMMITHPHLDHGGAAPLYEMEGCFKEGAPIYASSQAKDILPMLWFQTLRSSPYLFYGGPVGAAWNRLRRLPLDEFRITPSIPARAKPEGHINGAASLTFRSEKGENIYVQGDACWHDQDTVLGSRPFSDPSFPKDWYPDSVYSFDPFSLFGEKHDWNSQMAAFEEFLLSNPHRRVLIATLGIGRGQVVALRTRDTLRKAGITTPIYVDGMVRDVFEIISQRTWSPLDREFSTDGIRTVNSPDEREELAKSKEPMIVITSAGMDNFGALAAYLPGFLTDPEAFYVTTSFLPKGTDNLRILQNARAGAEEIVLDEKTSERIPLNCRVLEFKLTAHGNSEDSYNHLKDLVEVRGRKLKRFVITRVPKGLKYQQQLERIQRDIADEVYIPRDRIDF